MSTSSAPAGTSKPARPSVLSAMRRHIAAMVLIVMFTAGLGLAVFLTVSPLGASPVNHGPAAAAGVWSR